MATESFLSDPRLFKREVILALFADDALLQQLVLKGGNLLDVVYGISTRPSRDIDLSIAGDIEDPEAFRRLIEKALSNWFRPKGLSVFDVTIVEEPHNLTDEFREFWGGVKLEFKVIDSAIYREFAGDHRKLRTLARNVVDEQGKKSPIEISKHEYVAGKVTEIVDDFSVYAYSPAMVVAEKVRAICQQMPEYVRQLRKRATPRGRDFLDIHTVTEYFKVDFGSSAFHETVRKVFNAKRVEPRLISQIADEETRDFHRPDFISIAATVRPDFALQDYDFYFDYVAAKCRLLEALWDI
jgi:predicted nucleotidyltransferase component of viral defense system